jgi:hypothetical protein
MSTQGFQRGARLEMKKFFLALAGIAMLAGPVVMASAPAEAAGNGYSTQHRHHNYHKRHHRQVCRIVTKKRTVWRHHHPRTVTYKVRQCRWI